MKLHKFLNISSLIIPFIFGILLIFNQYFWNQNIILVYLFYCSIILSSILIAIDVFVIKKNKFMAFINLFPALFTLFFTIWQIVLANNHDLFHKYYDLLVGEVFSIALQIILIICTSIYLIYARNDLSNQITINREVRSFGIVGLIVYLIPFVLVIPAYFLKILFPWVIIWFVLQAFLLIYLSYLSVYKKLNKMYIPVGITIILYIISLILMIICEITNFIYPVLSIIYMILGLITIAFIAIELCLLMEFKSSKS